MPTPDQLQLIQQELDELKAETRINARELAGAIRKTRLNLAVIQQSEAIRRLRPPTTLLDWNPRAGLPTSPAVQNSLIDRLRRGFAVADSLGNTDVFTGQANLIYNPLLEGVEDVNVGTSDTVFAPGWTGRYVLNSGTAPLAIDFFDGIDVRGAPGNPLNSNLLPFQIRLAGAAARDIDLYLTSEAILGSNHTQPYLVAAARVYGSAPAHWTTADVTVELINTLSGTVVEASSDVYSLTDLASLQQLFAAVHKTQTEFNAGHWRLRIHLHLVSNGSSSGTAVIGIGEPLLHYAYSPDPGPFAPLVGRWIPAELAAYQGDDAFARAALNSGGLTFGDGTQPDVRIARSSAGALTLDSNQVAGIDSGLGVQASSGRRNFLSLFIAGDAAARTVINGDATLTGIELGPGSAARDTNLYRSAANVLKTDDTLDVVTMYRLAGRNAWMPARIEGFLVDNVPASVATPLPMQRFHTANTASHIALPLAARAGRVVAFAWRSSGAITAGNLRLHLQHGGSSTSVVLLSSASGTSGVALLVSPVTFSSGQALGVLYETDTSYAPTTLDWAVEILVEYEPLP